MLTRDHTLATNTQIHKYHEPGLPLWHIFYRPDALLVTRVSIIVLSTIVYAYSQHFRRLSLLPTVRLIVFADSINVMIKGHTQSVDNCNTCFQ